ncbi:hypothetical protein GOEFS_081_00290 [Gordonia effusa NBRC 100432]|uniref:Cell division protein FtsL n=1 Tax=Gordonia effusa NBRC 100432 TaxID=1077974 RepID=H0R2N9_9ACTN|nr:hypothetical protein [Gordonia effusa]GAB19340.1 hypothetical protein GOEFS_081_00290 [Gordonia effusa NBRC 100432]
MTLLENRKRAQTRGADTSRPTRSKAAQKAIDRRAKRAGQSGSTPQSWARRRKVDDAQPAPAPVAPRPTLRERVAGVPFVVPVVALIAAGMVLTLWLSTRSAQDSYELSVARAENQSLTDQRDALKKTFESADAAPDLSDKAAQLGLVPARNPARMVVGANGKPRVYGTPEPVSGRAPKSINPKQNDDPTAKIDVSKVEDSRGLPGSTGAASPTTSAPAPAPTTSPTGATGPAPATTSVPAPTDGAPTPNVLPGGGTPTTPNSGRNR